MPALLLFSLVWGVAELQGTDFLPGTSCKGKFWLFFMYTPNACGLNNGYSSCFSRRVLILLWPWAVWIVYGASRWVIEEGHCGWLGSLRGGWLDTVISALGLYYVVSGTTVSVMGFGCWMECGVWVDQGFSADNPRAHLGLGDCVVGIDAFT